MLEEFKESKEKKLRFVEYNGDIHQEYRAAPKKSEFFTKMKTLLLDVLNSEVPNFGIIKGILEFDNMEIQVQDRVTKMNIAHHAAYAGEYQVLDQVIRRGMDVNAKTSLGRTPLHLAAIANKPKCIDVLLNAEKIDPNLISASGMTALHFACRYNSLAAAYSLLQVDGIDALQEDLEGHTPLDFATSSSMKSLIQSYIDEGKHLKQFTPGNKF